MDEEGVFSRKTICFITGASRGLGKALAVKFAEEFSGPVTFVLLARCSKGLKDTAGKLEAISKQKGKIVNVCFRSVDLGNLSVDYSVLFSDIFTELGSQPGDFYQAMIVHNAGTLGDVSKFSRDMKDCDSLSVYFNLNVSNVIALNGQFLKTFPSAKNLNRLIINISSICALVATKTFSLYCTGKAARDMYFKVVAAEEADQRTCVLNYAPGPLRTEMGEVASTQSADPEVTEMFESVKKEGKILEPSTSAAKLIEILHKMTFKSGDHVDVFD